MLAYDKLADLAKAPYRRTDDRRLVAVFPMWFPYEILLAGGLRASEWWGFPIDTTLADAHFPPYVCTLVKANFEIMLGDGHRPDGMVFPSSTCDTIQNSAGLFRRLFPQAFSAYFRMTQNPDSQAAPEFLAGEIERVIGEVSRFAGRPIVADDLRAAIVVVNRFRQTARQLLAKMAAGKISVPAAKVYTAIKGALADISDESTRLLEEFAATVAVGEYTGPKLMLVGMLADPLEALTVMENAGAQIAGDDLGLGWRTLSTDATETGDPVAALVQRLLNAPPCSSLHFATKRRADAVVARARELKADAVVFTRVKFCDPEAFDYPNLKKALDDAGLPSLLVERELTAGAEGAIATRVEAFIEQIA